MPPLSNEEAKRLAVFRYIKGENGIPRNDGNPLMKGRWLDHCEEHVGNVDHHLLTLVSQGVVLTREGTICSSLEHASDIIHGYFVARTWKDSWRGLGKILLHYTTCVRLQLMPT